MVKPVCQSLGRGCASSLEHLLPTDRCVVLCCTAALASLIPNDPIDQRLMASLAPVLDPVVTYIYRTPATSDALARVLSNDSPLVIHPPSAHLLPP